MNTVDVLFGSGPNSPYVADMSSDEAEIVSHVSEKYGQYTGVELSEMTRKSGTPWSNSYFGSGRNAPLDQADIQIRH